MNRELTEWEVECLRWRGRILKGQHAHYCHDWDGLPVDETCDEYESCLCKTAAQPEGTRK